MSLPLKILFSLPSLLGLFNLIAVFYPKAYTYIPPGLSLQTFDLLFVAAFLFQVAFVLYLIWTSDFIEKRQKHKWTTLALFFNFISCFWFIWVGYGRMKQASSIKP